MASLAVYTAWVPAFQVMLHDDHDELPVFYAHIRRLAQGSAGERLAAMTAARERAAQD
jgi:predicted aminopeptidase